MLLGYSEVSFAIASRAQHLPCILIKCSNSKQCVYSIVSLNGSVSVVFQTSVLRTRRSKVQSKFKRVE